MTMNDHFIITLRISDRIYRLKVKRKDEQKYRDAIVAIEKKTAQYRNYFATTESKDLSEKDYLTMTTIQALSESVELEIGNKMFETKISSLIEDLDSYLRKSK